MFAKIAKQRIVLPKKIITILPDVLAHLIYILKNSKITGIAFYVGNVLNLVRMIILPLKNKGLQPIFSKGLSCHGLK